jgi:hypothetical protein
MSRGVFYATGLHTRVSLFQSKPGVFFSLQLFLQLFKSARVMNKFVAVPVIIKYFGTLPILEYPGA